jgi:hypothetical protein
VHPATDSRHFRLQARYPERIINDPVCSADQCFRGGCSKLFGSLPHRRLQLPHHEIVRHSLFTWHQRQTILQPFIACSAKYLGPNIKVVIMISIPILTLIYLFVTRTSLTDARLCLCRLLKHLQFPVAAFLVAILSLALCLAYPPYVTLVRASSLTGPKMAVRTTSCCAECSTTIGVPIRATDVWLGRNGTHDWKKH